MIKSKKKKVINNNHDDFVSTDIDKFLRWKALQLVVLGYRMFASIKALKQYLSFPCQEEVLISITDNITGMIDAIKNFNQLAGISEEEAGGYNFYITSIDEKNPLTILAEKKHREDEVTFQEHLQKIETFLKTITITDLQSFAELSQCNMAFGTHYFLSKDKILKKDMRKFALLEHKMRDTSCEAIGYWTAKLEEKKRNQENVKTRTTKKEKNKAILKEWMTTMKPNEYRLRAQKEFEKTERTILKWLQEIKDEKTAIMRKKDVTA